MKRPQQNLKLKARIIEKFGSQRMFAHHLGVHDSEVSFVVRGWRKPTAKASKAWSKALGCKIADIFPNEGRA